MSHLARHFFTIIQKQLTISSCFLPSQDPKIKNKERTLGRIQNIILTFHHFKTIFIRWAKYSFVVVGDICCLRWKNKYCCLHLECLVVFFIIDRVQLNFFKVKKLFWAILSIKMEPFEDLYGQQCRTPLNWSGPGERFFFGPDLDVTPLYFIMYDKPRVHPLGKNFKTSCDETFVFGDFHAPKCLTLKNSNLILSWVTTTNLTPQIAFSVTWGSLLKNDKIFL
ncbi:hypothetical protein ACJX0J_019980 [Zea mays]